MAEIISKVCGNCADYCSNCGNDPTCRETGQPVGYLWVRECWKEKGAVELGKEVADEITGQVSRRLQKPRGRKPQYPPVVDPETGRVVSKRCRICGEYKPIEEFYLNKTHKDGHGDECKPCHNQKIMEAGRRRRAAQKDEKPSTPPKKKENPAPSRKEPVKKEAELELAKFTDIELAGELSRRGWDVSLRMSHSLWEV